MVLARPLVLVLFVVGLACEGSAPAVPSAMALTSGNNQSGLPGVQLPQPLTVTLTGAGGAPFPGGRVNWSVSGSGFVSLSAMTGTSDASGVVTTVATGGITPGNVTVTASAAGVPPVNFQLIVLDPCDNAGLIDTDTIINGGLTTFDCRVDLTGDPNSPFFTDYYLFTAASQTPLLLTMSAVYDTYIELFHTDGRIMAFNDDVDSSGTNSNSSLEVIIGAGDFVIAASSFAANQTGAYAVQVGPRAATLTGCRGDANLPWITRGVTIPDQLQATDCVTTRPGGGRAFNDRVLIVLSQVRTLSATVTSGSFNPAMELYVELQSGPSFVQGSTNTAGQATISYAPAAGAVYRLDITSVDTVQTGAYTLSLTGPVPVMAGSAAPAARSVDVIRLERKKRAF